MDCTPYAQVKVVEGSAVQWETQSGWKVIGTVEEQIVQPVQETTLTPAHLVPVQNPNTGYSSNYGTVQATQMVSSNVVLKVTRFILGLPQAVFEDQQRRRITELEAEVQDLKDQYAVANANLESRDTRLALYEKQEDQYAFAQGRVSELAGSLEKTRTDLSNEVKKTKQADEKLATFERILGPVGLARVLANNLTHEDLTALVEAQKDSPMDPEDPPANRWDRGEPV